MLREIKWIAAALVLGLWALNPSAASADQGRRHGGGKHAQQDHDRPAHHWNKRSRQRHEPRWSSRRDRHFGRRHNRRGHGKYVFDDGFCRTTVKYKKHGRKTVVRCRDRAYSRHGSGGYGRHGFGAGYGPGRGASLIQPQYVARALDSARDGQAIVWNDSRAQTRYEVVPTETFRAANRQYCREYRSTATVGGQTRQVYGQACRQEDGTWEVVR